MAVAFVVYLVSAALAVHATAVFMRPMTQALGWSRTDFQWVLSFGTLLSGLAALPLGSLVDRQGGRGILLAGTLLAGGGTMLTALVSHRWEFFLLRGILVPLGLAGMGHLVVGVAIANWFIKRRGRAMAIATMGMSMATIALTPLAGVTIQYYGWRLGWVVQVGLVWILVLPLAALFLRRRPEDLGLLPDGGMERPAAPATLHPVDESWTRAQAMRTPAMWLITLAFSLNFVARSALFFHFVPYLTGPPLNLSLITATSVISAEGWAALLVKPPWGVLAERIPVRYCAGVNFLIMTVAILAIMAARPLAIVYVAFILWGIGIGGAAPFQELAYAEAFGRLHLGSIRALAMPFTLAISAVGPLVAAWLFDITGSYSSTFIIFASLAALSTFLVLLAVPPKGRPAAEERRAPWP